MKTNTKAERSMRGEFYYNQMILAALVMGVLWIAIALAAFWLPPIEWPNSDFGGRESPAEMFAPVILTVGGMLLVYSLIGLWYRRPTWREILWSRSAAANAVLAALIPVTASVLLTETLWRAEATHHNQASIIDPVMVLGAPSSTSEGCALIKKVETVIPKTIAESRLWIGVATVGYSKGCIDEGTLRNIIADLQLKATKLETISAFIPSVARYQGVALSESDAELAICFHHAVENGVALPKAREDCYEQRQKSES